MEQKSTTEEANVMRRISTIASDVMKWRAMIARDVTEQRSMIARDLMEHKYIIARGDCDGAKIYNSKETSVTEQNVTSIYSLFLTLDILCHHHHVVPLAVISLAPSRHFFLSFIASGRSSSYIPYPHIAAVCMFVLVVLLLLGHMWGSIGVPMSLSLLLQQCPACLVHLTWIIFMMGGRWPYSWCLVGCCHQDLFNIARNILV